MKMLCHDQPRKKALTEITELSILNTVQSIVIDVHFRHLTFSFGKRTF